MAHLDLPTILSRSIYSKNDRKLPVYNPATDECIAEVPCAMAHDSIMAIDRAQSFLESEPHALDERAHTLKRAAVLLREHQSELSTLITTEQGKPLKESAVEVEFAAQYFDWYAEEARRLYQRTRHVDGQRVMHVKKLPVGICGVITPWNFPLAMLARKVSPAIAAGCPVIAKPAPDTPLAALALALILSEAGVPPQQFQVLCGDAKEIVEPWMKDNRVRKISFTGSTGTGKLLMAQSAETVKRMTLELGGNAPCIVFRDADLEQALDQIVFAKFRNAGQTCISVNRLLVDQAILDVFTAGLIGRVEKLTVGNGLDPKTDIGPLINLQATKKVSRLVRDAIDKGAKLLHGSVPDEESRFVSPIVLSNTGPQMEISCEEVFGPVCAISSFEDEAQAIKQANDTVYGLAAYVFSTDSKKASRAASSLEFGMVGINDSRISMVSAPFGGVKQSGFGREGGHEGIEEYIRLQYQLQG